MTTNLRLFVALVLAIAGVLAPWLPLVVISDVVYRGVDRVPLGLPLAAPALFPLLSTTTRQFLPRRPGPRSLAIVVEAGWFVAIGLFGQVELAATRAPLEYLPGQAAVVATQLAGLAVGAYFGWRRPSDVVRR